MEISIIKNTNKGIDKGLVKNPVRLIIYDKNMVNLSNNTKISEKLIKILLEADQEVMHVYAYNEIQSNLTEPYIYIKCKNNIDIKSVERAVCIGIREGIKLNYKNFIIENIESYESIIARSSIWGSYNFNNFKTNKKNKIKYSLIIHGTQINKRSRQEIGVGILEGNTLIKIADLANSPGNIVTPKKISSWVQSNSKKNNLVCHILNKQKLIEKKFGGILSVSNGSNEDPRVIILKHNVVKEKKPIVIIGKTVTFDSGGISLKPGKDMGWMRYDKSGGMAVLAIMEIISKINIDVPVIGILGAAENMPSGSATKPGDIIKIYKGKTVEVLNTDAEGRLILADLLGLASDFKPRCIIDIATLTGAVISALGNDTAAVLGNNQNLINELIKSSTKSGEKIWQLPLYDEFTNDMKSDFADLSNMSKSGTAGTATAAAFLKEFVDNKIPWAHLDIAGTAWKSTKSMEQDPGATLFSVRLLVEWLKNLKD